MALAPHLQPPISVNEERLQEPIKHTPLINAVRKNNLAAVKDILINYEGNITETDEVGWTPLMHAIHMHHFEMVEFLVDEAHAPLGNEENCGWFIQEFVHQEQDADITRFILMRGKAKHVHRRPIPIDADYHHHVQDKEALLRGEHPWSKLEAKDLPLPML